MGKTKAALRIQNDGAGGLFELLKAAFDVVAAVTRPGAPVYVAHADTERTTFESAMDSAGLQVRQNLVWVKNMMALGR
ncbi:DNA modification methylase, partial [Mycobacteroides abscessus subsp. massiliense]